MSRNKNMTFVILEYERTTIIRTKLVLLKTSDIDGKNFLDSCPKGFLSCNSSPE